MSSFMSLLLRRKIQQQHQYPKTFSNLQRWQTTTTTTTTRTTSSWTSPYKLSSLRYVSALSFSTTSSSNNATTTPTSSSSTPNSSLERILYRQLIRWCKRTDESIPLSTFIPSTGIIVYSQPYNKDNLYALSQNTKNNTKNPKLDAIRNLLPPFEVLTVPTTQQQQQQEQQLWIPVISNSKQLHNFLRAVYRLNDTTTPMDTTTTMDEDVFSNRQKRISQAFQTLKSLNELNNDIQQLKQQHEDENNKLAVLGDGKADKDESTQQENQQQQYRIGQVVQHKYERWRGIIVGLEKEEETTQQQQSFWEDEDEITTNTRERLTSLTTKTYNDKIMRHGIKYQVILDSGDTHLLMPKLRNKSSGFIYDPNEMLQFIQEEQEQTVLQSEILPVTKQSLCRIRNNDIEDYFSGFDVKTNSFVLNELLSYQYPNNHLIHSNNKSDNVADQEEQQQKEGEEKMEGDEEVAHKIVAGVKQFSEHLRKCILSSEEESATSSSSSSTIDKDNTHIKKRILDNILTRLLDLSTGDFIDPKKLLQHPHRYQYYRNFIVDDKNNDDNKDVKRTNSNIRMDIPAIPLAAMHLRELLNITLELRDTLFYRRISKKCVNGGTADEHNEDDKSPAESDADTKEEEAKPKCIKFRLGDIVEHKVYGFRGVVIAWDPKPVVNVSNWDGIQHIENPMDIPFYHIIPDQRDCIEAFGSERPIRYVCEENLELCSNDRKNDVIIDFSHVLGGDGGEESLSSDSDVDNKWVFSKSDGKYTAPIELKFKHGEDIGDNDATETGLTKLQDELARLHLMIRDNDKDANNDIVANLSLENMFRLLKVCDSYNNAIAVEETLKEIFKSHSNNDIRCKLDSGTNDLLRGKIDDALQQFQELVYKEDKTYGEAWNKLASCEYMLSSSGSDSKDDEHISISIDACEKALSFIPMHFQALSGLGVCYYEQQKYDLAAEAFQRSLEMDPWSPASSKLAACLDLIDMSNNEDEDDDKNGGNNSEDNEENNSSNNNSSKDDSQKRDK